MKYSQAKEFSDDTGFAGTLRNIQLADIIQMCCLACASLCVRVKQDNHSGFIYIKDGRVIHAEYESIKGVQAFCTILSWKKGLFETQDFCGVSEPTIKEHIQFLLMEAARLSDEMSQAERSDKKHAGESSERIRVLIVDDSPIMSKIIASMLVADPSIEVVGSAKNGEEALQKMRALNPQLITMDINMPVMDGSTALKHIMIESPCPVLIMSNLAASSYSTILSFLNLGAVDFMSKPVKTKNIVVQHQKMVQRIHIASKAKADRFKRLRCLKIQPSEYITINEDLKCDQLVIVNSGVGGYLEMVNVITSLPPKSKSTIISLPAIPPGFTPTLAGYLNQRSCYEVVPLMQNSMLVAGRCYIGNIASKIRIDNTKVIVENDTFERRGNLDRLLGNAAQIFGRNLLVVLLSGADIGELLGLEIVRSAGGKVVAPKLSKCILPTSLEPAVDLGLINELFDPDNIDKLFEKL